MSKRNHTIGERPRKHRPRGNRVFGSAASFMSSNVHVYKRIMTIAVFSSLDASAVAAEGSETKDAAVPFLHTSRTHPPLHLYLPSNNKYVLGSTPQGTTRYGPVVTRSGDLAVQQQQQQQQQQQHQQQPHIFSTTTSPVTATVLPSPIPPASHALNALVTITPPPTNNKKPPEGSSRKTAAGTRKLHCSARVRAPGQDK
ncbi:uncharacterized protein Triagg1_207 [Trichoderma aggressivum f. europaeum]|uniref:Uncharacterized protein n=1 Tax=Trichoderma aggressivum f. europaeum TaxID=173218 RepID=A0AAE1ILU1_9HYPO|nr:hypothetical protein Triagg1_207 [Trichoderma aggressivum f. europaeum]